jgi:hypothetical protein
MGYQGTDGKLKLKWILNIKYEAVHTIFIGLRIKLNDGFCGEHANAPSGSRNARIFLIRPTVKSSRKNLEVRGKQNLSRYTLRVLHRAEYN